MKKVLLVFALLLIAAGALLFTQKYLKEGGELSFARKTSTIIIGGHSFKVVAATSQQEREIGLSKTKSLSGDQGMIFLFEKPDYYSFWMKNMKFPIDIIYINKDTIVTIHKNAEPPVNQIDSPTVYNPTEPSD